MSIRNLNFLSAPRSVTAIGAFDRPHSVGATVMLNPSWGSVASRVVRLSSVTVTLVK